MSKRPTTRRWSEEQVVFLIRDWIARYGDPPTAKEWAADPCYPGPSTVKYYFGTWSNAVRTAGGRVRGRGCPAHLIQPSHRVNGRFANYVTA